MQYGENTLTKDEALKVRAMIESRETAASKELRNYLAQFPKGPMGLTPDSVKASADYKRLRAAHSKWFAALRDFNAKLNKLGWNKRPSRFTA